MRSTRPTGRPAPTDAELAILQVLWELGPSTVRQVHDVLAGRRPLVYTTTLKTLQIMTEKGLTVRDDRAGQHVYRAAEPQAATERRLIRQLLDRAFAGSTARLIMQALASKRTTAEELDQIKRLIAEHQEKNHG